MSTTMPPGWYPDPGHTRQGAAPERWWDGTRWTGQVRPVDAPQAGDAPTGRDVARPAESAVGARSRRRGVVFAVSAVLVAVATLCTALVLTSGGGNGTSAADGPGPSDRPTGSEDPPAGDSAGPEAPDGAEEGDEREGRRPAPDITEAGVGGAVLPVYPGWTELAYPAGAAVTTGGYPCPRAPERDCALGGAFLTVSGSDNAYPQPVAEVDIAEHTDLSYSEETYGGVVAHREEVAEEITVAGNDGFRVRRWVETGTGAEAYAESVAFPAPDGSGQLLILRLGWVTGGEAPSEADIEQLVASVQRTPSAGTGTGV